LDVEVFIVLGVDNLEEAEWLPSAPILSWSRRFIGRLIKGPEVIKEGVKGGIDVIKPPSHLLFQIWVVVVDVL
jgi:hypothetical protein